ncbi:hypothetical protein ANN_01672 [Periplaneta americana]|uniref:Uncharacterized protein n=1 Tax=Periplaneta americana TaxID=6978 RepID=A0ABQ8TUB6_PERAM|nr:hypothetical protein ANN_01672 [Periplaneta americana]
MKLYPEYLKSIIRLRSHWRHAWACKWNRLRAQKLALEVWSLDASTSSLTYLQMAFKEPAGLSVSIKHRFKSTGAPLVPLSILKMSENDQRHDGVSQAIVAVTQTDSVEQSHESRGIYTRVRNAFGRMREYVSRPRVPQCSYVDVDPSISDNDNSIIYSQIVAKSTDVPHNVKFHDEHHIITGIACHPRDNKTASPETEVVSGGVGYNHVELLIPKMDSSALSTIGGRTALKVAAGYAIIELTYVITLIALCCA